MCAQKEKMMNRSRFTFGGIVMTVAILAVAGLGTPASACTSFCFDTPAGPVFGANMDLRWGDGLIFVNQRGMAKESYLDNPDGESAHWVSRYGSVTFNLVGIEMPWGGMNEAGLVISTMQLSVTECPVEDERYPMNSPTWIQHLLDTCATVEEVIAAQDSIRLRGDVAHFLAADAKGACVIVEWLGGETLIYAGEDLPVRALANAVYDDCLNYLDNGAVPAFNPGRSAERVAAADHWTAQYDPDGDISASDWALGVLTEAVVDPKKWWKPVFGEPYTQWSVAYDIARREIRFQTVDHAVVRSFDFAKLDFGCNGTTLMMDVNAILEGPVENLLQPYDSGWNYEFARKFLDRWDSNLSDEQVKELTTFFEGFECAP
jgi:penicillin V acylase-like amidase (Ntn superfamily)